MYAYIYIYVTQRVTFGPNAQNMTSLSNDVKIMHQIFMFLIGFSAAHKNCKKLFSDKIDINISYLCKIISLN